MTTPSVTRMVDERLFDRFVHLEPLLAMASENLRIIAEEVASKDKPLPPQIARHARKAKTLATLIIEEINNISKAEKATATKKK